MTQEELKIIIRIKLVLYPILSLIYKIQYLLVHLITMDLLICSKAELDS